MANMTFRGPRIVIYSYNKNQGDALFLKFIFDKVLYMFWTDLLSIISMTNTYCCVHSVEISDDGQ